MDYALIKADKLISYTDATANPKLGFGGYFVVDYMYQNWDEDFVHANNPSIGYLELYAVTAVLLAWMHKLANRRIVVFVDNKSVEANLNTMTSTCGCKNSMVLIRLLVLHQMIHNVRVYAKYVKSSDNTGGGRFVTYEN